MQLALHLDRRGIPAPSRTPRWPTPRIRGILRNPTYTGSTYAQRAQYRTLRSAARRRTRLVAHMAVPQPSDIWLLVEQVPAIVSRERTCISATRPGRSVTACTAASVLAFLNQLDVKAYGLGWTVLQLFGA